MFDLFGFLGLVYWSPKSNLIVWVCSMQVHLGMSLSTLDKLLGSW